MDPFTIRLWPTFGLLLAGIAILALPLDATIAQWATYTSLPGDIQSVLGIGELYGHGIGVLFILLSIAALDHDRRVLARIACCAYIPGLLANLLKVMVARERPIVWNGEGGDWVAGFITWWPLAHTQTAEIYDYAIQSFPSGHTATAVGLTLGLAWRYPRGAWFFALLAIMTGMERIASRAHYPSDVLGGAALAVLISGGFVNPRITGWVFDLIEKRDAVQKRGVPADGCKPPPSRGHLKAGQRLNAPPIPH